MNYTITFGIIMVNYTITFKVPVPPSLPPNPPLLEHMYKYPYLSLVEVDGKTSINSSRTRILSQFSRSSSNLYLPYFQGH